MVDTGLTLTRQPPLSTAATTTADAPASVLWNQLAEAGLAERIEDEVMGLVGDVRPGQRALVLEDVGVTALDGLFASALASLVDDDPIRERWQEQTRRLIGEFGAAERSVVGLHAPLSGLANGPLAVLDIADVAPVVAIHVDDGFEGLRADQRNDIVGLFADLAAVCDLRIVASGFVQTKLRREFHGRLPVSRPCNTHPSEGEVAARVEQAREALGPDGRETKLLRDLAAEAGETLRYHALYAEIQASESRVRQCIGRLADHNLVATFDGVDGRAVELLAAGREYLDVLDSEIGRQQSLSASVSDPPNPSDEYVYAPKPPTREDAPSGGACGGGRRRGGWTQAAYMNRHEHVAVCGAVDGADIALSDHPIEGAGRSPLFSYDDASDEVAVGAEFHGSLQWLVCVARALAGPKMWNYVLTPERLDADVDLGALPDPEIWTRCSQGGWCSKDERTAADYIERLADVRDGILEKTREYRHQRDEDDDEQGETARWIIRHCQGLIGTVTRMLDYCDIDLTRYVQLPEYASDWHTSEHHVRRRSLLRTIVKTSTIAGAYGAYTAERTMYESRPDKREFSLGAPEVTSDESGDLIGSWVIAGRGVSKLLDPADGPSLPGALRSPDKLQEDGENYAAFDVPLSIWTDRDSETVRAVVRRILDHKNLYPTDSAVNILTTCTGSVFDVTRALNHLGAEPDDKPRPVHLDELRRALATVPADRLLADSPSRSVGKLLKTMLNTPETLTQTELANRAGVSAQTVRNNADILGALALVERIADGPGGPVEWRCSLPTREERDERGLDALNPKYRGSGRTMGGFERMVRDLTECIADDAVLDAYGSDIRDLNTLIERCPALTQWLRLAVSLRGMGLDPDEYDTLLLGEQRTTGYGESPPQASLAASAGVAD